MAKNINVRAVYSYVVMKKIIRVFVMPLLLYFTPMMAPCVLASEQRITLGTDKPYDSPSGKYLSQVYSEAFKRLGMVFHYVQIPPARSSLESNSGRIDGELSRVYKYQEDHPHVVRVEESHWRSGFIAVAADPSISLNGWESLKNTNYTVTYTRGVQGCESILSKIIKAEKLETVTHARSGLKKVQLHRTDLYIDAEHAISYLLDSDEFKNSSLLVVGVMEEFTAHAYMHEKHKELVPKLSAVLKEMKKEGLLVKYQQAANMKSYFEKSTD